MALIQCPYCGNQISDMAAVCPACGYQLTQPVSQTPPPPAPYSPAPYPQAPQNYGYVQDETQLIEPAKRKGIPGWLIALIVLLSLAIIGVVLAIVLNNKKADTYEDYTNNIPTDMISESAPEMEYVSEEEDVALGPVGRDEWQEYKIDSKNYGYVNVREYTTTESAVVKVLYDGDHFFGNRLDYDPDWIEVFDEDGDHIGYVYYYCARKTGNHS